MGTHSKPMLRTFKLNATVFPRSSDQIYIVSHHIQWVTTFWTYSTNMVLRSDVNSKHVVHVRRKTGPIENHCEFLTAVNLNKYLRQIK